MKILILFCLIFLVSCSGSQRVSDLELTWRRAVVTLPQSNSFNQISRKYLEEINDMDTNYNAKVPLVIYLHGCTGIGNFFVFDKLASEGYAVIAIDSFARRFRPLQCDPRTNRGGKNLYVYDFRLAELTYALETISNLSWIDFDNLFLIGVSEGAVAAALFRGDVFNARIIAQWTCSGAPLLEGIAAPQRVPILAIVKERDPYYDSLNTLGQDGNCETYFEGRFDSKSIVIPYKKNEPHHDVFLTEGVLDIIVDFLERHSH